MSSHVMTQSLDSSVKHWNDRDSRHWSTSVSAILQSIFSVFPVQALAQASRRTDWNPSPPSFQYKPKARYWNPVVRLKCLHSPGSHGRSHGMTEVVVVIPVRSETKILESSSEAQLLTQSWIPVSSTGMTEVRHSSTERSEDTGIQL
jgi:hypothetical protein